MIKEQKLDIIFYANPSNVVMFDNSIVIDGVIYHISKEKRKRMHKYNFYICVMHADGKHVYRYLFFMNNLSIVKYKRKNVKSIRIHIDKFLKVDQYLNNIEKYIDRWFQ